MSAEPDDFDLSAAWLRRAEGDIETYVEALAARLEAALPGAVVVERRRDGLFSRKSRVTSIGVRTESGLLTLRADHHHLHATRAKIVRGVSLGSEEITVPVWLDAVLRSAQARGAEAGSAHDALHDFLMA